MPRVSDGTRRLAVVNLNWDHVRSVDILAVLRSFVPAGGRILSVTVYPSEFGEQRMAEEATVGPGGLLASKKKRNKQQEEEESEDEEEAGGDSKANDEEVNENLRRYELDRLRYYFAVVTFDSVSTSERVYAECDGAEFEGSSLPLDLRFIPEDLSLIHI